MRRQKPTNVLSVFDHFAELEPKVLIPFFIADFDRSLFKTQVHI